MKKHYGSTLKQDFGSKTSLTPLLPLPPVYDGRFCFWFDDVRDMLLLLLLLLLLHVLYMSQCVAAVCATPCGFRCRLSRQRGGGVGGIVLR